MTKLSELTVAGTLNPGDIVPIVQNSVTLRTTVGAIASMAGTSSGSGTGSSTPGYLPISSFAGSTFAAQMQAALSYIGGLSASSQFLPYLVPPMGSNDLGSTTLTVPHGTKLFFPGQEREFGTASGSGRPSCVITSSGSNPVFALSGTAGQATRSQFELYGIQFSGSQAQEFLRSAPYPNPFLSFSTWRGVGFKNFLRVYSGAWEGVTFDNFHIQNCVDTPINIGGSDNFIGVGGPGFIDSQSMNGEPVIWCQSGSAANTLANLYITPTDAGCAIRIDGGEWMLRNLIIDSASFKAGAPTNVTCRGSAIQVRAGVVSLLGAHIFDGMYDPANASGGTTYNKGLITVTGGKFSCSGVNFMGQADNARSQIYTPQGTPMIYAGAGATYVSATGNLPPSGFTYKLQQATAGLIRTEDTAALVTAV